MSARITNAPITRAQIRAIHVELRNRDIDDAAYRMVLKNEFNASSCKDLTRREASRLLSRLGRPLQNPPGVKPHTGSRRPIENAAEPQVPEDGVVHLATKRQRDFVDKLRDEVAWENENGYRLWLMKSLGISRIRTRDEAARAIEGLRGLKRHGHARPPDGAA